MEKLLKYILELHSYTNLAINIKNYSLSIMLTAVDQKPHKSLKGDITQHHVDFQAV